MKIPIHWDRRSGFDRRVCRSDSLSERRDGPDRRASGTDRYVLIISGIGIDSITLLLGLSVFALAAAFLFNTVFLS